jgi:hypothetical protein
MSLYHYNNNDTLDNTTLISSFLNYSRVGLAQHSTLNFYILYRNLSHDSPVAIDFATFKILMIVQLSSFCFVVGILR